MYSVYTHAQQFHVDELMAIALLDKYFLDGKYDLYRINRDSPLILDAQRDIHSFVIDFGFIYDPYMLNFDHHQNDESLCWEDGTLYSSCGLVWSWLKNNNFIAQHMDKDTVLAFENKLSKKLTDMIMALKFGMIVHFLLCTTEKKIKMNNFIKP